VTGGKEEKKPGVPVSKRGGKGSLNEGGGEEEIKGGTYPPSFTKENRIRTLKKSGKGAGKKKNLCSVLKKKKEGRRYNRSDKKNLSASDVGGRGGDNLTPASERKRRGKSYLKNPCLQPGTPKREESPKRRRRGKENGGGVWRQLIKRDKGERKRTRKEKWVDNRK